MDVWRMRKPTKRNKKQHGSPRGDLCGQRDLASPGNFPRCIPWIIMHVFKLDCRWSYELPPAHCKISYATVACEYHASLEKFHRMLQLRVVITRVVKGLDHVSRKIKLFFHNSRKTKT